MIFGVSSKDLSLADFLPYKREVFRTDPGTEHFIHNGKPFDIIRGASFDEIDEVVAPMFHIVLEDGTRILAYMEEIFEEALFDELITDGTLTR